MEFLKFGWKLYKEAVTALDKYNRAENACSM